MYGVRLKDRKKLAQTAAKTCQKMKKPVQSEVPDTLTGQAGCERKRAIGLPASGVGHNAPVKS
jgi:hypothetical protein